MQMEYIERMLKAAVVAKVLNLACESNENLTNSLSFIDFDKTFKLVSFQKYICCLKILSDVGKAVD